MITLDRKTKLGRWYLWNSPFRDQMSDETDICKFIRRCFILGPLKILIIAIIPLFLLGVVIGTIIHSGWLSVFIPLLIISGGFILVTGSLWTIKSTYNYIQNNEVLKESWKSWRDKHCSKVKIV